MAGKTTLRKFRRTYDCEILRSSHDGIILGTLCWDPVFRPIDLGHPDNHICNSLLGSGLIDEEEHGNLLTKLKGTPTGPGAFAGIQVDVDIDTLADLEHPEVGKIGAGFDFNRTLEFRFGDIQVREFPNLNRVHLSRYLDQLKAQNWDRYRKRLRRAYMITECYYGSVEIEIDRSVSANFEAEISNTDLEVTTKVDFNGSTLYTFAHDKAPFAVKIERVRDL